jgi:hypothetical protein
MTEGKSVEICASSITTRFFLHPSFAQRNPEVGTKIRKKKGPFHILLPARSLGQFPS